MLLGRGALLLGLVAAAGLLLHLTRETTFWFDEWQWILDRRDPSVDATLSPHNGHLSAVPVLLYQLLFATAGLDDHLPYRILIVAGHLTICGLVFVYIRRRVGDVTAGVLAVVLVLFGPGWQNFLWPFQIGMQLSVGAGVAALLALDRRDRVGDAAASALVGLSLASSGFGVPVAAGVAVDVLLSRRHWRALWIVAAPLALYALWLVAYREAGQELIIGAAPLYVADSFGGTVAALAGLAGPPDQSGAALEWGRPLGVVVAVAAAWRLSTLPGVPGRALALLAILLAFWALTGATRAGKAAPDSSRYLYDAAVFLVLLGTELCRGVRVRGAARWVALAIAGGVLLSNSYQLRLAAGQHRDTAALTRAALGAVELSAGDIRPDALVEALPGHGFIEVGAGAYLAAARDLGPVGYGPQEVAAAPEPARTTADAQLLSLSRVALAPPRLPGAGASAPAVSAVSGGTTRPEGACVAFRPAAVRAPAVPSRLELALPPEGVLLRAGDRDLQVALRRFAAAYRPPFARLRARRAAVLQVPGDRAPQPWHVQLSSDGPMRVCAVG